MIFCDSCNKEVANCIVAVCENNTTKVHNLCFDCSSNYFSFYTPPLESDDREEFDVLTDGKYQTMKTLKDNMLHALDMSNYDEAIEFIKLMKELDQD